MGDPAWNGFEVGWVARACGGRVIGDPAVRADRFERDTRGDLRGAIYVALRGAVHDGHSFLGDAVRGGAAAVMVEAGRWDAGAVGAAAAVEVTDAVAALADVARAHRQAMNPLVLAVGGSCGKTSTKEILASILRFVGPTCATEGNLNNHIGVPFTLLRLRPGDRFAVVELGCDRAGEIAALAAIARPDIGAITCVGEEHLQWLGTIDGAARAEGELFEALGERAGTAVVNVDDPLVARLPTRRARRITVGESPGAGVRLLDAAPAGEGAGLAIRLPDGVEVRATLRMPGRHQARNAAMAAAAAFAAGAPAEAIRAGIEGAAPVRGRGVVVRGERGVTVIDDTYNSNPTSAAAAIETLRALPGNGRRVAVLAEMLEMGEAAERVHRAVGREAAASGVDLLVCVGEHARAMREGAIEAGLPPRRVLAMDGVERLLDDVWAIVGRGDRVLVKGSRGMRMERVVERLSRPGAGSAATDAERPAGGVDAV